MRIHILGICGTFMGGVAVIARQLGFEVSGSDENVYPPMSDTLHAAGIEIMQGYDPAHLDPAPDCVVIGNALSRGNPAVEYVLNKHIKYCSGPEWLAENVLQNRHVLAVSGTHGKTTTTSILTWILESAGLAPGFLVGGVPLNFNKTAALGSDPYFVIEADEYDSAFYDKRSKFLHYRPRTLIMNNLEYDHADIFPDMEAIKRQFQFLLRTVPSAGTVIFQYNDHEILDVVSRGCWASKKLVGGKDGWQAKIVNPDGSKFELWHRDQKLGVVEWMMLGHHNVLNALAAIAASHDVGVSVTKAIAALKSFKGIKRRLELRAEINGVKIYDDFAHHPTAIATTIEGLRARAKENERIIAVLQFGSNTMKMGVYRDRIASAFKHADRVLLLQPDWDISTIVSELGKRATSFSDVQAIIDAIAHESKPSDHILIMSNKGFDGIHKRLLERLSAVRV